MSLTQEFFKAKRAKNRERSKAYRKLMGISIPDRDPKNLRKIKNKLWYIVWEGNLLQPKVFKYAFVTDYFAKTFATKYLSHTYYCIFRGSDLKQLGLTKAWISATYSGSTNKGKGVNEHKYNFPDGLSRQRRKTLRTNYRRNLRRKLIKLFKNKKMADQFVLDKINEKPGVFFKKLKRQWFFECTYSQTFREWLINEEGWRLIDIDKAAKGFHRVVSQISNIVVILEAKYNDEKYDYKDETYVSAAIKLHKLYQKRIERYMGKKGYTPKLGIHNAEEAFKELVYRGWLPDNLLQEKMNPRTDFYLKATVGNLVWPGKFSNQAEVNEYQHNFGIMGYVGINDPGAKNR